MFDPTPFLPVRRFNIHSPLTPSEAHTRLREALRSEIVRTSGAGWLQQRRTYRGSLTAGKLIFYGPYGHRQTTLATEGIIEAAERGSVLRLRSTATGGNLAAFVIPMGLWIGVVLTVTWGSFAMLFPLLAGCLFYGLFLLGVKSEASDIATMLARMLDANT